MAQLTPARSLAMLPDIVRLVILICQHQRQRRIVRAYRSAGTTHANSFQLFATRPLRTKAAIAQGKELVDAFAGAGLNTSDAVIAYRAITCFSAGFVLLETSNFKPAFSTGSFDLEFNRSLDVILRGVQAEMLEAPPLRKPRLAARRK